VDAPKAGADEVDAAAPDDEVDEPNEKAAAPVLKPGVADDAPASLLVDEVEAAPKEKPEPLATAAAPSVLGALAPNEKADEDAAPVELASAALPKLKAAEIGALPPVGAEEPKEKAEDPKLDVDGAGAEVAAGSAADAAAGAASGALPSAASSASSSLLPVDSKPTSTFLSGHWKPPVTQPFLAASAAFFEALGSTFD